MKKLFIFIFLFASLAVQVQAQDTTLFKYFPLKVNNQWVYFGSYSSPVGNAAYFDRYKIESVTQINNKTYFVVIHNRIMISWGGTFYLRPIRVFKNDSPLRIDSANLNIYMLQYCSSSPEILVDSLRSKMRDSSSTCGDLHGNRVTCWDTLSVNIFGTNRLSKNYSIRAFEGGNEERYVKDIGVSQAFWYQLMETVNYNLRGCVINGVLYGDTNTVVGIKNNTPDVPASFSLSQNYPNPFNPVTKIKFDEPATLLSSIGEGPGVRLIIYDALGREVTVLVNEQLLPGTYEVEWNATNYPSGIYFYKLIAYDPSTGSGQSFTETRKMVLIK